MAALNLYIVKQYENRKSGLIFLYRKSIIKKKDVVRCLRKRSLSSVFI